jgi:hypothetical protein
VSDVGAALVKRPAAIARAIGKPVPDVAPVTVGRAGRLEARVAVRRSPAEAARQLEGRLCRTPRHTRGIGTRPACRRSWRACEYSWRNKTDIPVGRFSSTPQRVSPYKKPFRFVSFYSRARLHAAKTCLHTLDQNHPVSLRRARVLQKTRKVVLFILGVEQSHTVLSREFFASCGGVFKRGEPFRTHTSPR